MCGDINQTQIPVKISFGDAKEQQDFAKRLAQEPTNMHGKYKWVHYQNGQQIHFTNY